MQAVAANFFDHDFGFEFYDGAVAAMALHYYSEAQKLQLYKNLRAGLKKDGFFLLTDKFAPTQNYQDFCRSEFERKRAEAHQPEGHYYTFYAAHRGERGGAALQGRVRRGAGALGEIEHGGAARHKINALNGGGRPHGLDRPISVL